MGQLDGKVRCTARSTYVEGLAGVRVPVLTSSSEPEEQVDEEVSIDDVSPRQGTTQVLHPVEGRVELINPTRQSQSHFEHGHEGLLDIAASAAADTGLEGGDASVVSEGVEDLIAGFLLAT